MEEQKAYYAIIPANVRYDEDLPPNAKLLYGEITALCNEKGYCWATNEYFAKLYHCTKQSVSEWIKKLKNKGYIWVEIVYREGSKEILNRYIKIFEYPIQKNLNTPIQKNLNTPIQKNLKDNNTNVNITSEYNINNEINNFFEKIWGMLKSTPYDRKSKVSKKRKKELYKIGFEKIKKAIDIYLEVQDPKYYHRRDNFFNEIIDNFIGKDIKDFKEQENSCAAYDLDLFEKMLNKD